MKITNPFKEPWFKRLCPHCHMKVKVIKTKQGFLNNEYSNCPNCQKSFWGSTLLKKSAKGTFKAFSIALTIASIVINAGGGGGGGGGSNT
ncbi:MAG: hypothetical protein RKO25_10995 [Candidatus Contendobacter sp.]|nr:hypothetical protein [Candidatus Contendobacter sp.]